MASTTKTTIFKELNIVHTDTRNCEKKKATVLWTRDQSTKSMHSYTIGVCRRQAEQRKTKKALDR